MLPVVLGAMALVAVGLLAWSLRRGKGAAHGRGAYDRAVFRDQLAEISRDRDRGLIGEDEARAARAEIERRALTALEQDREAPPARPRRMLALAVIVALPAAAGGLYYLLGRADLPDQPFAARAKAPGATAGAQLARLVEMVEKRLAERPGELQGWKILSTAYLRLARPEDAEAAYRKALALSADDPAEGARIAIRYGEALLAAHGGVLTPPARAAFADALRLAPADPAARYYDGLARLQGGDAKGAIAAWQRLVREAPAGAPWLDDLKRRIARVARDNGIDPATIAP